MNSWLTGLPCWGASEDIPLPIVIVEDVMFPNCQRWDTLDGSEISRLTRFFHGVGYFHDFQGFYTSRVVQHYVI